LPQPNQKFSHHQLRRSEGFKSLRSYTRDQEVQSEPSEAKKKSNVQNVECKASEADDSNSISSCPTSCTSHSEAATVKTGSPSHLRVIPKQEGRRRYKSDDKQDATGYTGVSTKIKPKTPKHTPRPRVLHKINAPMPGTKGKGLIQRIIDNDVKVRFKVGNKPAAKSSGRPTSVWGKGKILMPATSTTTETAASSKKRGPGDLYAPRTSPSARGLGVMSRERSKESQGVSQASIGSRMNMGFVPPRWADETTPTIRYEKENLHAPTAKCVYFERPEVLGAIGWCDPHERKLQVNSSVGFHHDGLTRPSWDGQVYDSYCYSKDDVKYPKIQELDREARVGVQASEGGLVKKRSFRTSLSIELDKISNWEEYGDEYVETSVSALSGCRQEEDSDLISTISASACISSDISDQEDDMDQDESQRSGDWMDYALSAACLFSPVTTPPTSCSTLSYFGMADESKIV
jgi:hypothetical protein